MSMEKKDKPKTNPESPSKLSVGHIDFKKHEDEFRRIEELLKDVYKAPATKIDMIKPHRTIKGVCVIILTEPTTMQ